MVPIIFLQGESYLTKDDANKTASTIPKIIKSTFNKKLFIFFLSPALTLRGGNKAFLLSAISMSMEMHIFRAKNRDEREDNKNCG